MMKNNPTNNKEVSYAESTCGAQVVPAYKTLTDADAGPQNLDPVEGTYINNETVAAQNNEAPAHGLKFPLARPPVHPQVARCGGVLWQRLWQRWQCKQLERLASCLLSFPQCASRSARQLALDAFLASCSPTLLHSFHLLHMHTQGSMLAPIMDRCKIA